ncbi:putative ATP synthase 24 kDa subunit, mitochondrial [Apium graveolens]|uniref:putative ATP synthase 24 kDa subunit, mitochondrial n=1 Tax=Apium graveolens TaxID=4045 RepID=UPI003D79AD69
MAFASRLLSRSTRQVYTGPAILQSEHAAPVRLFATAPPATEGNAPPPKLKGDEMLKNIFLDVKKKYETAMGILRTEKITLDPEDPAAVSHYAKVMKTIREKAQLFSESERIKYTIQSRTKDIEDARTHMLALKEIRIKRGLPDELGAEAMMMDAVEKVEKQIKKPLLKIDKEGMAMLNAEFEKINKKLGISHEKLPKYEEELELKIAKAQLEELSKDALEAMETQKKREEFKEEEMPEVKSLDIRNFL